jgi:methionyl-tRNA formyltransferase
MKLVVIGTDKFAIRLAEAALDEGLPPSAFVSMPASALPLNSADIRGFSATHNIPLFEFEDLNAAEALTAFRVLAPDYVLCSWPRMLGKDFLGIPKKFVIGTHPTELPFNRGRHPLHWLIAQGISRTKLSFFHMDEGVDSGRLLEQIPIEVSDQETINSLNDKVDAAAYQGAAAVLRRIKQDPTYDGVSQDQALATYWRKRTPHDVTIDLRLGSQQIERIVRSFTSPYPCANLIFEDVVVKICEAQRVDAEYPGDAIARMEPGKVVSIDDQFIRVKTADGVVALGYIGDLPKAFRKAKYIHPPTKYFAEWPTQLSGQL